MPLMNSNDNRNGKVVTLLRYNELYLVMDVFNIGKEIDVVLTEVKRYRPPKLRLSMIVNLLW